MALSDKAFIAALESGAWTARRDGEIITADELTIGPNSVNVSIGGKLMEVSPDKRHRWELIDLHEMNSATAFSCSCKDGFILQPGKLYLASTRESFDCSQGLWIPHLVSRDYQFSLLRRIFGCKIAKEEHHTYFYPVVDGRSTCGRIGLSIHQTAGRGDYGFAAPFTLELTVVEPTSVYEGDEIGQIYFEPIEGGQPTQLYTGSYARQYNGPEIAHLGEKRFQRFPVRRDKE